MAHWHCVVAGFSQLHVLSLYSRSTASIAEKECLFSSYDLDLIVQTHTQRTVCSVWTTKVVDSYSTDVHRSLYDQIKSVY